MELAHWMGILIILTTSNELSVVISMTPTTTTTTLTSTSTVTQPPVNANTTIGTTISSNPNDTTTNTTNLGDSYMTSSDMTEIPTNMITTETTEKSTVFVDSSESTIHSASTYAYIMADNKTEDNITSDMTSISNTDLTSATADKDTTTNIMSKDASISTDTISMTDGYRTNEMGITTDSVSTNVATFSTDATAIDITSDRESTDSTIFSTTPTLDTPLYTGVTEETTSEVEETVSSTLTTSITTKDTSAIDITSDTVWTDSTVFFTTPIIDTTLYTEVNGTTTTKKEETTNFPTSTASLTSKDTSTIEITSDIVSTDSTLFPNTPTIDTTLYTEVNENTTTEDEETTNMPTSTASVSIYNGSISTSVNTGETLTTKNLTTMDIFGNITTPQTIENITSNDTPTAEIITHISSLTTKETESTMPPTTTARISTSTTTESTTFTVTTSMPSYTLTINGSTSNVSNVYEKDRVILVCIINPKTSEDISWSLNGSPISNSTRRYVNQICNSSSCSSLLFVNSASYLFDKGSYTCSLGTTSSQIHELRVYQKPKVTINPRNISVLNGSTVNFTCTISNCGRVDQNDLGNLTWCLENLSYTTVTHEGCQVQIAMNITKSLKVHCGYLRCTEDSFVGVFDKGVETCKQNTSNDVIWRETKTGTTVIQNCPEGFVGTMTRKCEEKGNWLQPQISKCTKKELHELNETIGALEEGPVDNQILDKTLNSINSIVNDSGSGQEGSPDLQEQTVLHSTELLKTIAKLNVSFTNKKQAETTTKTFLNIADTILKDDSKDKLKSESVKENTATNLIESVDNFGETVSESLKVNEFVKVIKDNLVVEIKKTQPKKVNFPASTKTVETTKFVMEKETLKSLANGSAITFTAVKYKSLGSLLNSFAGNTTSKDNATVDSEILSLSIHGVNTSKLEPPLQFTFQNKENSTGKRDCSYLDLEARTWAFKGCKKDADSNNSITVCSCTHLTNFAILMSPIDTPEEEYERLRLISLVGCSLSVAGAVLTIAVYFHFWRHVKNRRSILVVNLCFSLSGAYLLFLLAVEHSENKDACTAIAALLHYLFLAMFCFMLTIGIDLAIAILQVFRSRSSWVSLLLIGWGMPAVIVAATMGATQLKGYGDERFCWLRGYTLYGFIVPVLFILLVNIIIVIAVMKRMYSTSFMMKKSTKQKTISGLRSICAILPVLGLTWGFGVLSVNTNLIFFQYLFAICNSMQGLFIFIFHCVFNISVRKAYRNSVRKFNSRYSSSLQQSSKQKLVTDSSSDDKIGSGGEVQTDQISDRKMSGALEIPRFKVSLGLRSRPNSETASEFNDKASRYSQYNTYM